MTTPPAPSRSPSADSPSHEPVPTPRDVVAAHGEPHEPAPPGGPAAPALGTDPAQGSAPGAAPVAALVAPGDSDSDGDLADRVVARVLAVPGVVRLHAGVFGEVATYLPGRTVPGVRLRPDGTEVHVVVSTARPIPPVARDVHETVRELVPEPVRVYVEDLEPSPSSPPAL